MNRVLKIQAAAMRWLPAKKAIEVANNIAMPLMLDEQMGVESDPLQTAVEALEHRARHFGLRCDVQAVAQAMADAWREA